MDDEITGMYQLAKIFDGLDEEARARLIRWAADKYGVDVGQPKAAGAAAFDDQSMFMEVDPEKVAAARVARESGEAGADFYSLLSARVGSTRVARNAGIIAEATATSPSTATTPV